MIYACCEGLLITADGDRVDRYEPLSTVRCTIKYHHLLPGVQYYTARLEWPLYVLFYVRSSATGSMPYYAGDIIRETHSCCVFINLPRTKCCTVYVYRVMLPARIGFAYEGGRQTGEVLSDMG